MKIETLALCRSLLFLPASNARAVEKARALAADMVILDLEDAVKVEEKDRARAAAVEALELGFGKRLAALRINADPRWFALDCAAAAKCKADLVVLPKVESARQATEAHAATGKPLLAMIESSRGVLAAPDVAAASVGLLVGVNDLAADLRLPPSSRRAGLGYALQAVVLAARAAGVCVFDGVYNQLEDPEGLAAECREGRALGFDGKSLIHPNQIEAANQAFGPSEDEIVDARRLIAAATQGAERFEDRMVEDLHVAQARAVLARARP